jgi:hypothetical protein
VLQEINVR